MSWQQKPFSIDVKAGETLYLCGCGQSKNGPYCDGTHKTVGGKPFAESFTEDKKIHVCGCGKSGGKPYCDGSHKA
ncbi:MAG: glutamate synthase [Candidatus Lambdaproteobacteria bacterium RIFOXYD2_FULL_50_16]|uniref:Glutamate synthase n=1 Tax=Candidatus Lambdaproteobacteria bacterium RIFOXYD2_FULL_50_16 TaxID=1817772 RepID=A0A1F6GEG9_9PROT|nr:MAG: glutamate synthase [Candidatus Lambdaproteobacteria bacterium RIFOXYD2_FULL_50_16]